MATSDLVQCLAGRGSVGFGGARQGRARQRRGRARHGSVGLGAVRLGTPGNNPNNEQYHGPGQRDRWLSLSSMFEPVGDQPQWCAIYNVFTSVDIDELVTYDELSEAAGFDVQQRRSALYTAQRHLEEDCHRTLACVPGKGYRVAQAREHERLATNHQRRARRQVVKARRRVSSANRADLDQVQRDRLDLMASHLDRHEQMLRTHSRRIDTMDEARKQQHRRSQADIAALNARLEMVERQLGHAREATDQPDHEPH